MNEEKHDEIRGLRAAAKLTERSPSGLQKLVDSGDLPATKVDGVYVFAAADLEALRAGSRPAAANETATEPSPEVDVAVAEPAAPPAAAPAQPAETQPTPRSDPTSQGEIASMVFADLNAGKTLCAIVVERKLPPDVVRHWHDQWVELAHIDTLRTPAGERRLFGVERELDIHKESQDQAFAEIGDVRERLDLLEQMLGIQCDLSECG
jgi:hypothetical protein